MKWLEFKTKGTTTIVNEEGIAVEQEVITPLMVEDTEEGRAYAEEMSYDGIIEEYDDGEPEVTQTPEERIAELEEALALLLSGVTE